MITENRPETPAPTSDAPQAGGLFDTRGRPDHLLHAGFLMLRDSPLYEPARELLCELRLPERADADFIERFQTAAFEACLFDIYLATMFEAAGLTVHASQHPRFELEKGGRRVVVDPVMVGVDPREALKGKLRERAWALPQCAGKPYVLAVEEHSRLSRSAVASEFFRMPHARHVSALLFCGNNGSICKFNRIGQEAGHPSKRVRMLRHGTCRQSDAQGSPAAAEFCYEVGRRVAAPESWNEETVLVHNPGAPFPLERGWLGAATEEGGCAAVDLPPPDTRFVPVRSTTEVLPGDTPTWWVEERAHVIARDAAARALSRRR